MTSAAALIDAVAGLRAQIGRNPQRLAAFRLLQQWQVERLRRTYADFSADPRFTAAINFFIGDLYGPHDLTFRDRDLKRVLRLWENVLPQRALQALACAVELDALTFALDAATLDELSGETLDEITYAAAYRSAGRREDRQHQIALVLAAGEHLDALIRLPAIGAALTAARVPARLLKLGELQDFLERGHRAFKRMGAARDLLDAIGTRETTIMDQLLAGKPDPFRVARTLRVVRPARDV